MQKINFLIFTTVEVVDVAAVTAAFTAVVTSAVTVAESINISIFKVWLCSLYEHICYSMYLILCPGLKQDSLIFYLHLMGPCTIPHCMS